MQERRFGPVRILPGENGGKYPACNSIFVESAGVLIDPGSDRRRLERLRDESEVKAVWLSHWHEDHITHLDLFEDVSLWVSEQDAPPLEEIEVFFDWYGMPQEVRDAFRPVLLAHFHYRPRKPAGFLEGGSRVQLGDVTVRILHTPGHTPGHMAFFFEEPRVAFLADYDLTRFGPWYGDRNSSLGDTIASIKLLRSLPARTWITGHAPTIFDGDAADAWDRYQAVILEREKKLLEHLRIPRSMEEIIEAWIVHGKPREPRMLYAYAEQAVLEKHLETLMKQKRVVRDGDRYTRLDERIL